jgi:CelD/BcsL family acetyltransferase involved in cellulose biosynthesis
MPDFVRRTLRSRHVLDELASAWDDLADRCPWTTPFQRPAWVIPWLAHLARGELRAVVVAAAGRLAALGVFVVDDGVLRIAGHGTSDYLDVLVDPALASPAAAVCELLDGALPWSRADLDQLRPGSPLLEPACAGAGDARDEPGEPCPRVRLSGDLDASLPPSQLARLRRDRRRALSRGPFVFRAADGPAGFETLLALHEARWAARGGRGVLADPAVVAFHREAVPRLDDAGRLRMRVIELGGKPAACLYGLGERDEVACYLQGIDPAAGALSPGVLLVGAVLEEAAAEGKRAVDFLRGREPYKFEWGALEAPTVRRAITRAGEPCNRVRGALR